MSTAEIAEIAEGATKRIRVSRSGKYSVVKVAEIPSHVYNTNTEKLSTNEIKVSEGTIKKVSVSRTGKYAVVQVITDKANVPHERRYISTCICDTHIGKIIHVFDETRCDGVAFSYDERFVCLLLDSYQNQIHGEFVVDMESGKITNLNLSGGRCVSCSACVYDDTKTQFVFVMNIKEPNYENEQLTQIKLIKFVDPETCITTSETMRSFTSFADCSAYNDMIMVSDVFMHTPNKETYSTITIFKNNGKTIFEKVINDVIYSAKFIDEETIVIGLCTDIVIINICDDIGFKREHGYFITNVDICGANVISHICDFSLSYISAIWSIATGEKVEEKIVKGSSIHLDSGEFVKERYTRSGDGLVEFFISHNKFVWRPVA